MADIACMYYNEVLRKNSQWKCYYTFFTTLLKQKLYYANDWLVFAFPIPHLSGITMLILYW